jgi:hypothetical protein
VKVSARTKVITTATILSLIAVYAASTKVKEEFSKAKVVLTGMWLESPRPEGVRVTYMVGGSKDSHVYLNAPTTRSYRLERGVRVQITLTMLGKAYGKFLGCVIKVDGFEAFATPAHSSVAPGHTEICWAIT